MTRCYSLPLLVLLVLTALSGASAQVTAWRPFRPGLVYAFRTAKGDSIFTLRVDSVYADGPDSVYRFNRTLRVLRSNRYVPTKNNLFGARMQFRPGTGSYTFYLEADVLGVARQWTLQSGVKEGRSYEQPAGVAPASTARALSRQLRSVAGLADSVLTLRTQPDDDSLVFSRRYGAVQLPRSLYGSQRGSRPLYLAERPVPVSQSRYYAPALLFDYQPGDEFGFQQQDLINPFPCSVAFTLRRILSRQQSADSLIYTYLEQTRNQTLNAGAPGCGPAGSTSFTPSVTRRLAFSLRTGRSPQHPYLGLLAGEYQREGSAFATVQAGRPITRPNEGSCLGAGPYVGNERLFRLENLPDGSASFRRLPDGASLAQTFTSGVGEVRAYDRTLEYSRRQLLSGPLLICGTPLTFSNLLPTRPATDAPAAATLHPNPASSAATLTLAAPARPGTTLTLTDVLGRRVWSTPVAAGQTALPVPLAGRAAGLYLVRLAAPGAAPRTWRLQVF